MSRIFKIVLITPCVLGILVCIIAFIAFMKPDATESYIESFDKQYMYTQLYAPKKILSTIVILENTNIGNIISYSVPYFDGRTIRKIAWGLNSNDLFIFSSDTGLAIYRRIDGIWMPCYFTTEKNDNGTYSYYLYKDCNKAQRELWYELPGDTIPKAIKAILSERVYLEYYGANIFQ